LKAEKEIDPPKPPPTNVGAPPEPAKVEKPKVEKKAKADEVPASTATPLVAAPPNGVAKGLPENVIKAKTFREVVIYLQDTENLKEKDAIAARCEELRGHVGVLKPVKNMAERVDYVLEAMRGA
jgi:hypothetical protein